MQTLKTDFKSHAEEVRYFKKWLRAQGLNALQELYVMHLYFNVGGWDAVNEWLTPSPSLPRPKRGGKRGVKIK